MRVKASRRAFDHASDIAANWLSPGSIRRDIVTGESKSIRPNAGNVSPRPDSGEVFLLLDDHNNPDPYDVAKKLAGDRAEVSGKKVSKPGVTGIVVGAVKGL